MFVPQFPGHLRKNDALFMFGASQMLPFVHVYAQEAIEVVHGPSCKPELEIEVERCSAKGIAINERRGGGGTVVLSPGMLVILVVGLRTKNETPLDIFSKIHGNIITILELCGIPGVEEKGISDLTLNNKKILGSSLYLGTNPYNYYYQSSLMIDSDLSLIDSLLKHPPREPDYRQGRDHRAFCTTICKEGFSTTMKLIQESLTTGLPKALSVQFSS